MWLSPHLVPPPLAYSLVPSVCLSSCHLLFSRGQRVDTVAAAQEGWSPRRVDMAPGRSFADTPSTLGLGAGGWGQRDTAPRPPRVRVCRGPLGPVLG